MNEPGRMRGKGSNACHAEGIENEQGRGRLLEFSNGRDALGEQGSDIGGRAIAEPDPNALWRRPEKQSALAEILVLGDDSEGVCCGKIPNVDVAGVR